MTVPPRATEVLATFFYLGKAPLMPGTVGTLGAIPLVIIFNQAGIHAYTIMTFIFVLLGVRVTDQYESAVQDHDSKEIVIDEVAGYLLAMFWLPHTWQAFLYSFLLFRFLDIVKPFPMNYLDRRIQGGFGVMVDDLAAGVITNLALQIVFTQTDWLGVQYQFSQGTI